MKKSIVSMIVLVVLAAGMGVANPKVQATFVPGFDYQQVLQYLADVFKDFRLYASLLLIFLELGLGLAAAWRTGTFEWAKTAQFYKTSVLPYLTGYVVLYVALHAGVDVFNLGPAGDWISETGVNVAWATFAMSMADSILASVKKLGYVGVTPTSRRR